MKSRMDKISGYRRNQPIEELQRKWNKAKGRWSNSIWATEWLDLAYARANIWYGKMKYR